MLISRKRRGACHALVWAETEQRHRCGMFIGPEDHLPRWLLNMPAAQSTVVPYPAGRRPDRRRLAVIRA